ncbi:DUF294 nucleotidyltransferase-like domain-containing protein [Abyssalbus ytuae]|uniref:DUF294 nucleotidyltransferase-like domain-containing protein n=1 Tax=Abyssalbus ytuae TaxID=2926907 RepID=A0A9E6ZUQ4_9FLAO|nr:DUF294 nucleotidyltransferase-like domain-containing protein [Abyssalbus ytuae]UOB17116.1 DUF294 nucleotidyltransferase-like domain-containing protein [Abyssalbus ytuae]
MSNIIAERVYDFLKNFPPFSFLERQELLEISGKVKVIYLEKNEFVFKEGETTHNHFYIVKDGAIGILREQNTILVDQCDEGDIFGIRALIRKGDYFLSAQAIEESIVYSISSELLERIIETNNEANKFLITSFATNTRNPYSNENKGVLFTYATDLKPGQFDFTEIQSVQYSKHPVTCSLTSTIQQAATIMARNRVGSIVIEKNKKPYGIITDKDLRLKVATGNYKIEDNVQQIMSRPVITYPPDITIAEAQIAMIQHGITHLCITEDGTPGSMLTGVLSEHDILVVHGNNPSVLIKEIKRSDTTESLKYIRNKAQQLLKGYLEQNIPVFFISKIISKINEAVTEKVIRFSVNEMESPPPVTFGWLSLGSQGRKEQLLFTDQDNALVFENVAEENYKETKKYFLTLSKKVTDKLHVIGFEYCPANMMASNPKWCLSVNEWKKQFNNWIVKPDEKKIMLSTIFFDYDIVYGNKKLIDEMSDSIFTSIGTYTIFLNFLGLNALKNPPPLGFFRQFLVEETGEHKDQFDIKARALMPLVDAARLLILSHSIKNYNNTILRFEKLIEIEPQNRDLYISCINAFKILLRFRTVHGLQQESSGRFIDLNSLGKSDRLKLKSCFKPIKEIQELIRVRFQLSHLM